MQEHIPDALIAAFECQYGVHWNHAGMRNERLAMRYGWAAAMEAKQCLHQIQEPASATAVEALREAEAALEVAMARILKADPGHSISVTSEAKALVAVRSALGTAPVLAAQPDKHPDDAAVDALAALMKAKLAKQRAKGYGGWDSDHCSQEKLSILLRGHVDKGDPVDVANFCAFLSARGEGIAPQAAPAAIDGGHHVDG